MGRGCEDLIHVKKRQQLTYSGELQLTGEQREITANWGDGEVTELLLPAADDGVPEPEEQVDVVIKDVKYSVFSWKTAKKLHAEHRAGCHHDTCLRPCLVFTLRSCC